MVEQILVILMQRIPFLFIFWRTNPKGAQPAKASAAAGDAANVAALQLAIQRARAYCNQNVRELQLDSQRQRCSASQRSSAAAEAGAALPIIKNYIIIYYINKHTV